MAILAAIVNSSPTLLHVICPAADHIDDEDDPTIVSCANKPESHLMCSCEPWKVPPAAILPLLFWIFFASILAYLLMTWANKYAEPSSVLAYTPVQPLTSALLTVIIVQCTSECNLAAPGYNVLGGLLIVGGQAESLGRPSN